MQAAGSLLLALQLFAWSVEGSANRAEGFCYYCRCSPCRGWPTMQSAPSSAFGCIGRWCPPPSTSKFRRRALRSPLDELDLHGGGMAGVFSSDWVQVTEFVVALWCCLCRRQDSQFLPRIYCASFTQLAGAAHRQLSKSKRHLRFGSEKHVKETSY